MFCPLNSTSGSWLKLLNWFDKCWVYLCSRILASNRYMDYYNKKKSFSLTFYILTFISFHNCFSDFASYCLNKSFFHNPACNFQLPFIFFWEIYLFSTSEEFIVDVLNMKTWYWIPKHSKVILLTKLPYVPISFCLSMILLKCLFLDLIITRCFMIKIVSKPSRLWCLRLTLYP